MSKYSLGYAQLNKTTSTKTSPLLIVLTIALIAIVGWMFLNQLDKSLEGYGPKIDIKIEQIENCRDGICYDVTTGEPSHIDGKTISELASAAKRK